MFDGVEEISIGHKVREAPCAVRMAEFSHAPGGYLAVCGAKIAFVPAPKVVEHVHMHANYVVGVLRCGKYRASWD